MQNVICGFFIHNDILVALTTGNHSFVFHFSILLLCIDIIAHANNILTDNI